VLQSIFSKDLRHHNQLPKLQASLMRTLNLLINISKTKKRWCKPIKIAGVKLQIHVIAKEALKHVEELQTSTEAPISEEDGEVLALAITATRYAGGHAVYLVSTDRPLLQAAEALIRPAGRLGVESPPSMKALTPSQLLKEVPKPP